MSECFFIYNKIKQINNDIEKYTNDQLTPCSNNNKKFIDNKYMLRNFYYFLFVFLFVIWFIFFINIINSGVEIPVFIWIIAFLFLILVLTYLWLSTIMPDMNIYLLFITIIASMILIFYYFRNLHRVVRTEYKHRYWTKMSV